MYCDKCGSQVEIIGALIGGIEIYECWTCGKLYTESWLRRKEARVQGKDVPKPYGTWPLRPPG